MMLRPLRANEASTKNTRFDRATMWLSDWLFSFVAWGAALVASCLATSLFIVAIFTYTKTPSNDPIYVYIVAFALITLASALVSFVAVLPAGPIAAIAIMLSSEEKSHSRYFLQILIISLASLISAYLYDYAVPGYRLYSDDSPEWKRGLTLNRYLCALAAHGMIFFVGDQMLQAVKRREARNST